MIAAKELRTEYLDRPMGLDIRCPRLFWKVEGAKKQTAYEIRYRRNGQECVNTQKKETSLMYADVKLALQSRDRVEWSVRLTDGHGETGRWSDWTWFEMGLLESNDWKASWIMGNYEHSPKKEVRYPADCFQKKFSIHQTVMQARLYITACGVYETYLNGTKVGDRVLTPGSTAFQKRVHYQAYNVTSQIREQNCLSIELADGFYSSQTGCFDKAKVFGHEPKLLAQLELNYPDGTKEIIGTDETFSWSNDGAVRYADMKAGEDIDSRKHPSYSGHARKTKYTGKVCFDNNVPVREKEVFVHPKILKCPDGQNVLDFGQNIAGYMEFTINGKSGAPAEMIFGEKLDENGNFTVKNISLKGDYDKQRMQTVRFLCNGTKQTYKPRFTVMGFQYVLLRKWPESIRPENFRAIAVYSDMPVTGKFECSDEGIRQIVENTLWSMKGNFLDVPTDCPTRERAGWTGDAQLFFQTGNYLMNQASFFRKWLYDVEDCQKKTGMIYNINPANPHAGAVIEWFSVEGGVGWGDAFLMIPYYYWKRYGDDRIIRAHWENMKRCFRFYEKRVGRRNLFTMLKPPRSKYSRYLCACGRDFGEWTEPEDCAPSQMSLMYPHPEEGTAYIAYDAGLMAEMAEHMGEKKEAERLKELSENIKNAYRHYFLGDGTFETNRMCKYVRPCALGIAEGEVRENLLKQIVRLNRERNYRVGTGFLSTPFLMELLTEAGASDDAYRTLTNPDFGWMQQIREGATTVWENWTNDASLNHYSKGACCQWIFDCVCGIQLDGRENHFRIEPHPVSQIDHISFHYDSVYGTVKSGWKKNDDGHIFYVTVPDNCTAEVILPNRETMVLESGDYEFETEDDVK